MGQVVGKIGVVVITDEIHAGIQQFLIVDILKDPVGGDEASARRYFKYRGLFCKKRDGRP